jgi:basic amino acid/polyamine antiporter, APA family
MNTSTQPHLLRALSLGALIIYGVGDILGAGIYAVIGKIAGHAGSFTWLAFAIAMAIVFLTALSYSELGSRFPKSGGVSVYVQEAFGNKWLSILAGLLLFSATILSMSTLTQAFVGYLNTVGYTFPKWVGVLSFLIILFLINIRGIRGSSLTNILSTAIEVSGLIIVLVCGFWYLLKRHYVVVAPEPMPDIKNIFQGAALAFFAFTGFEDLVNVAEEVKQPEKNLPRAILSALGAAGILYLGVSWIATAIIPGTALAQSDAPLLAVVKKSYPVFPAYLFSIIALFAVFNTTLLNYITASRLLYGMSHVKLMPKFLQTIHKKYHTPYIAIIIVFPLVLVLGWIGTLQGLAGATSAVVLTVFSLSSIALIRIKWREGKKKPSPEIFQIPYFVPWLAVGLNSIAISFLPGKNIVLAAAFIGVTLVVSWIFLKLEEYF